MSKQLGTRTAALTQLTLSRLREFYRQPEAVFWVYFFPILMVVALGIAFRDKPIEKVRVDVCQTETHPDWLESLRSDSRIVMSIHDESTCRQRLRTGKTDLFIVPDTDAQSVEYFYDPTRPGSIVARDLVDSIVQSAKGRVDPVRIVNREFQEPGGRYIDFLVPGLLGMGLMGGGLWGVGFAVVDMRIRKLLKRFLATPMRKTDFLMGIMLSRLVFMIPEIILLLCFSWLFFDVRIYGSLLTVVGLVLLGAFEFAGIGLLVASRARTLESVSGLMNLVMLPMWTLSGIFFSYERFPAVVQPLIRALPLTPLIDSLRAVMLEGAGWSQILPECGIMAAWAVVSFAVALMVFRWSD